MKNILFILISICSLCAHAQKQKGKPVTVVNTGFGSNDSTYFSSTKYRLIGPFRGGRSAAVAGSFKNENTFYLINTLNVSSGSLAKSICKGFMNKEKKNIALRLALDKNVLY